MAVTISVDFMGKHIASDNGMMNTTSPPCSLITPHPTQSCSLIKGKTVHHLFLL